MRKNAHWPGYPHVLEAQQFDRPWYEKVLFPEVRKMERVVRNRISEGVLPAIHRVFTGKPLAGKIVDHWICEPSTRTAKSFVLACHMLGAFPLWMGDPLQFSAMVKGETIEDSVRISNVFFINALVIRHQDPDVARRAAAVANIPVIDAGSGTQQHTTQAMLDIYSMLKELGKIDGLRVALCGDVKNSRTIRSLAYTLPLFKVAQIHFIGPKLWTVGDDVKAHLEETGIYYQESCDLREIAANVDVVYLTRAQTERSKLVTRYGDQAEQCIVLNDEVLEKLNPGAVILHPLPRNEEFGELPDQYTYHPQVKVFNQAQNGLFVRMALLKILLG